MSNTLMNARAGGTINVCRFVIADTTAPNSAVQASAGTSPFLGVSQNSSRINPYPDQSDATALQAALVGEIIGIHPAGAVGVDLYCNEAWAPGDLLMADASGYGIVATTGKYAGARAQGTGVVGALCPVDVINAYKV